jgi:hypothetical protein
MDSQAALIIIIALMAFISTLVIAVLCYKTYNRHKAKLEELMKYNYNINASIDEKIPAILESFVNETFTDYRAMNIDPRTDIVYINDEKEKEIIEDLTKICIERISPAMVDKLSLFWSYNSIGSVVADKIYLTVVAFVAEFNAIKQEKEIR